MSADGSITFRLCGGCGMQQPESLWRYSRAKCDDCERARAREWHRKNPERSRAAAAAWKAKNPDKCDVSKRKQQLAVYGLTHAHYAAMLVAQNFSCGLCEKHVSDEKKRLAVDHDHETGKVRMLLCHNCNKALGLLRDDPALLRRAADYVERFK